MVASNGLREDPRRTGARYAIVIAMAWAIGSGLGALAAHGIGLDGVAGATGLVAIGSAVAVPPAGVIGWSFSRRVVAGQSDLLRMAITTVLANAVLVAVPLGVFVGIGNALSARGELIPTIALAIGGSMLGVLWFLVPGLLIFSLPGFAVALISAYAWHRLMRRRFGRPL